MVDEVVTRSIDLIQELFNRDPLVKYAPPLAKYPNTFDRFAGTSAYTAHTEGVLYGSEYDNQSFDTFVTTVLVAKVSDQLKIGDSRLKLTQTKDSLRATLLASNSYPVEAGTKILQSTPYYIVFADDILESSQSFTFSGRSNVEYPEGSGFAWVGFTVTAGVVARNFTCV